MLGSVAKRSKELMFQGALPLFDPWQYPQVAFSSSLPSTLILLQFHNRAKRTCHQQQQQQQHKDRGCAGVDGCW